MKKVSIGFLFLTGAFVFASCNNRDGNGSTDTSNTDASHSVTDSTRGDKPATENSIVTKTPVDKETSAFIMAAASGNMLEVQMGQLAVQKGKSQRVKDFGSMIVNDHGKANEELKSLAVANGVTLPTALSKEDQEHVDMMNKLSDANFDKEYISMMIEDHKEDIKGFKKEAGSSDNVFKDFAVKVLPTLEKHLDSAQAIHGSK